MNITFKIMPPQGMPQNQPNFDNCVRQLADTIGFKESEKLNHFIRNAVQWLLTDFSSKAKRSKKAASDDGITFQTQPSAGINPEFDLDFYRKADRQSGVPVAAIKFGGGYYNGLPDRHPKVERLEDLPPLVARRLVFAKAFRKGSHSEWSPIRHNGKTDLKLDFQLNEDQKEKK